MAADGELTLVDPTAIVPTSEGVPSRTPIDAGEILVMAVSDGGPATLVGIDANSGGVAWTYAPASGQLDNCARQIIGSAVACAVTEPAKPTETVIVLIDAQSGHEVVRADAPGQPVGIAVGADIVVTVTDPHPQTPEGEAHAYAVTAFDATGEQQWSTRVEYRPSLGRGPSQNLDVGESWTGLELNGSVYVLRTADGELVIQRDVGIRDEQYGQNWAWAPLDGALIVFDDATGAASQVLALTTDGTEVTLTGYTRLSPVLDEAETTLLRAPDGQLVTVDPDTGEVHGTGVTPSSTSGEAQCASEVDGVLLVEGDALRGYDLDNPADPAWEQGLSSTLQPCDALTDGSTLYVGGLPAEAGAVDGALVYSALNLTDGSLTWTLTMEPENGSDPSTVVRGGGCSSSATTW